MPRFAEYFATVSKGGKITAITEATPAHELHDDQVMLTQSEWRLLLAVGDLGKARQLIGSIEYKIAQLTDEGGNDSTD